MVAKVLLSKANLVSTALEIADTEGLDAVTTRRIAAQYHVSPMALYGHFASKEHLLDGLAERILTDVLLDNPHASINPRERLKQILTGFLVALREHPELAPLVASRIVSSGPGLLITERVLSILLEEDFSARDAAQTASFLLVAVIALASPSPGYRGVIDSHEREAITRRRHADLIALDPAVYPATVKSAEELANCSEHETYFGRGIALLIAGVFSLKD